MQDAQPLPLAEDVGAVSVLIFTRSDCPIANRYAPEINRIYEAFAPEDVRFHLVYPDPRETDDSIQAHLKEFNIPFDAIHDPEHRLVGATGATMTPEAVVFSRSGRQVYRGRIDDRYVDYGRTRPAPTRCELRDVLSACVTGQPPAEPMVTPAVGCRISDLR